MFPIMRTNVQVRFLYCLFASFLFSDFLPSSLLFDLFFSSQPHFTSTSGGRYDAKGKTLFQLQFLFSLIIIMTPQANSGVPGWYGHGLYFSEHLLTAQVFKRRISNTYFLYISQTSQHDACFWLNRLLQGYAAAGCVDFPERPLVVIEAAGCLKTYEKTSVGHECTTLVMDKYTEVATHTSAIQTACFPSILGRPHAAPVVRGVFMCLGANAQSNSNPLGRGSSSPRSKSLNHNLQMSVGPWADGFWKVVLPVAMFHQLAF